MSTATTSTRGWHSHGHKLELEQWDSDFEEALAITSRAKSRFLQESDDLYTRGKRLIVQSVESGVTVMRAHVEVDTTVLMTCLDVGLKLKNDLARVCEVQIAGKHYCDHFGCPGVDS